MITLGLVWISAHYGLTHGLLYFGTLVIDFFLVFLVSDITSKKSRD